MLQKGPRNPEGLAAETLEWVRVELAPCQPLTERLFLFAIDGTGVEVLSEMEGGQLGLVASSRTGSVPEQPHRLQLLDSEAIDKPEFLFRLSQIYLADLSRGAHFHSAILKAEAPWLEVLLQEVFRFRSNVWPKRPRPTRLSFATVRSMCLLAGASPDLLHRMTFQESERKSYAELLAAVHGLGAGLDDYPELVTQALKQKKAADKILAVEVLQDLGADVSPYLAELLELGLDRAKTVRHATLPLLKGQVGEQLEALVEAACQSGPPSRRRLAEGLRRRLMGVEDRAGAVEVHPPLSLDITPLSAEIEPLVVELIRLVDQNRQSPDGPEGVRRLMDDLETLAPESGYLPSLGQRWNPAVDKLLRRLTPKLTVIQGLRLMLCRGHLFYHRHQQRFVTDFRFCELMLLERPSASLRDLAHALEALGLEGDLLGRHPLSDWERGGGAADQIWPYFDQRPHLLEQALLSDQQEERRRGLRLLKTFPVPPERFRERCWELALGEAKGDRPEAQACLAKITGYQQRVIDALGHGRQQVRQVAAEWLARLDDQEALEPLFRAARKEKQEGPKAAMLAALEAKGQDLAEFFDPALLLAKARKGMKKGRPKALVWFPWDRLPDVRWQACGTPVNPIVLDWFVTRSHKLKEPAPGPLLRRYCQRFQEAGRRQLGDFVLRAFLAREAEGSAVKDKGILALVGACGGSAPATEIERYLKAYYGTRAVQCKALLQTLAAIEEPACVQLLLSVAHRFRTRGIQQEADLLVGRLAERRGWTRHQLEDRTVPTAGLDERGLMELDYGGRRFEVSLDQRLHLVLSDPSGKPLKRLPPAGKSDDADRVKNAKKLFSAAKKELSSVLKLQKERLYEAMCLQRTWSLEEWRAYLGAHPILGHYCRRLLWVTSGEVVRFTEDGTFVDSENEQIDAGPELRLAHALFMNESSRADWSEHFDDYEILPVFSQIETGAFHLPDALREEEHLSEFEGHLLPAFTLRNLLTRAGFVRGEAEDGGWFYEYRKIFPGLELEAVITFSGSRLPEENTQVALRGLHFRSARVIPLGQVPPVLLCECRADLQRAAAAGPGFDPEWATLVSR